VVERKSAKDSRYGGRCARIARARTWLLVAAALAVPAPALAQDRDTDRSAQSLWDEYPLHPADADSAAAAPSRNPPVNDATSAPPDDGVGVIALLVAAIAVGGITAQLVSMRRGRTRAVAVAAAAQEPAPLRSTSPRLWTRAARMPAAEPEDSAPLAQPPPALTPVPPPAAMGPPEPPEPDRAWAAEIEWHLIDGGSSQFRITARPVDGGAEPVTLGASEPLEWPPRGSRSVQALTEAVRALETALVENGWSALPRGSAWYAKRYTWQPGARPRPALGAGGRTRHRKLYHAEYGRQLERTTDLRRTISDRLTPPDGDDRGSSP
jgi:hypothetical protein